MTESKIILFKNQSLLQEEGETFSTRKQLEEMYGVSKQAKRSSY
jgi:hypothetical protein